MATTKQAAPAKKSEGFQGVRGAFWIIVVCAIIAFTLFFTWFGNDMHFQDPGVQDHPSRHLGYYLQRWCNRTSYPHIVAHSVGYDNRALDGS